MTGFISRREHLAVVGSTNDVVRDWLTAGVPEVCVAVADVQLAGRGRNGRTWVAPAGTSLLLSIGTRPAWIAPGRAWRVPATASLAMAEAAEVVAGLAPGTIRLKWPNDLVVAGEHVAGARSRWPQATSDRPDVAPVLKLGGVLAESTGLGGDEPRLVVGLGVNVDWEADAFPADLAASMASLRLLAGRPVSRDELLATFIERLERGLEPLRDDGRFALDEWAVRQLLPGTVVQLEGSGDADGEWLVVAVDAEDGALVVADATLPGAERRVVAGEAVHVRLAAGRRADHAAMPAGGIPAAPAAPAAATAPAVTAGGRV